jgi:hypothetical protein
LKTIKAFVTIRVGEISDAAIARRPQHYAHWFKNPHEPTETEIKNYFEFMLEDLGSSNSGSEEILNSPLTIQTTEA